VFVPPPTKTRWSTLYKKQFNNKFYLPLNSTGSVKAVDVVRHSCNKNKIFRNTILYLLAVFFFFVVTGGGRGGGSCKEGKQKEIPLKFRKNIQHKQKMNTSSSNPITFLMVRPYSSQQCSFSKRRFCQHVRLPRGDWIKNLCLYQFVVIFNTYDKTK
jgi:hypothetical protein